MIYIAPKSISPMALYKNWYEKLEDKNSTIYNDKWWISENVFNNNNETVIGYR